MPRRCTVCDHSDLEQINRQLIDGLSLRTIADRWAVSKTALIRHKAKHLPASLVAARQAKAVASADDLRELVREAIEYHLPPEQFRILKVAEESERELIRRWASEARGQD